MHRKFFSGLAGAFALSSCVGPVVTMPLSPSQHVAVGRFAFAPMVPDGPNEEMRVRTLVTQGLKARGFTQAADATYVVETAASVRPTKVAVYNDAAKVPNRDDVPRAAPFLSLCHVGAVRVTVIITDRATGKIASGARAGQTRCLSGAEEALPGLVEAALNEALR